MQADRADELERIHAAGGRVIFWDGARVFGMLAMSRAIGDSYLKPFVISDPEVRVVERKDGEDEFLILASDGLWDVVSNEDACEVARACLRRGRAKWCAEAASLLTKLALARRSSDNVSVVVVDLRRRNHH